MRIIAYFYGGPGDPLDKACRSLFEAVDGARSIGAGTMLVGKGAGERDVEYDVPDDKADDVRAALKKAGFRLTPTPSDHGLSIADDAFGVPAHHGPLDVILDDDGTGNFVPIQGGVTKGDPAA